MAVDFSAEGLMKNPIKQAHQGLKLVLLTAWLAAFATWVNAPVVVAAKFISVQLAPGVTGAEIQRALDTLPAVGGEVVLPPGTIRLSQPIVLQRDFQTLRG